MVASGGGVNECGSARSVGSERPYRGRASFSTLASKERYGRMQAMESQVRPRWLRREAIGGGRWVSIRPIEAADAAGLSDFYASLTPDSIRRRFLGSRRPTASELARFTDPGAGGVVAVLAAAGPTDGAIVGHGSVQPCGGGEVELAFAVADELQGRGIGSMLMRAALAEARRLGARRVSATMLIDNTRMRRLLLGAGWPIVADRLDAGIEEISLARVDEAPVA
jgi:GNAT superfamily N-acetyltransferase